MDIVWVIVASGPLTLLFVIVGGLLRAYLGQVPGWFYLGGLGVCTLILVWATIWDAQHPYAELDAIPVFAAAVNAVIGAVALAIGWVVQRIGHARRTRAQGGVPAAR
jgi:hypothetical protein